MTEETQIWVNKAEEDFKAAEILLAAPDSPSSAICFHCQQAIEKYLKAFLVNNNIDFPRTHDILELIDQFIIPIDNSFENIKIQAETLIDYAVAPRYPDYLFEPTRSDANEAFDIMKVIREFILLKIR
jgi:HEPN domain-containing protein